MDGASLPALARLLSETSRTGEAYRARSAHAADHLHAIENLEKDLKRVYWGFDLESIDEGQVEEILGDDRLKQWHEIKNLAAHWCGTVSPVGSCQGSGSPPRGCRKSPGTY